MEDILLNIRNFNCNVDDVVIHSATAESYIKHLEKAFALLLKHGLRTRLKKCSFMQPHMEMLGICIGKAGIHTVLRKVLATINHQDPEKN